VRSELGGKAGGLSACLSSTNGQIVGGGVGGPLIAAGPVEVPFVVQYLNLRELQSVSTCLGFILLLPRGNPVWEES